MRDIFGRHQYTLVIVVLLMAAAVAFQNGLARALVGGALGILTLVSVIALPG